MVDSRVKQVPSNGATAEPHLEGLPRDDPLPDRSAEDAEDDLDAMDFSGTDLAADTMQDKKDLAKLRQSSSEVSELLFVSV